MEFYAFDDIRERANCREIGAAMGLAIDSRGRCAATWRGGTNTQSVTIEDDKWYDHSAGIGGGAIELVAAVQYGGNIQQAQEWLGQYLHLTPSTQSRNLDPHSRYQDLIDGGYIETARYRYQDSKRAEVLHVVRLEADGKPKQFVQYDPQLKRWRGIDSPPLYRLADVQGAADVVIVEGEKDADRLQLLGMTATTCAGGSKKWRPEYGADLAGKTITILYDNDAAGQAHADQVAAQLAGLVAELRIICPMPDLDGGDASDYLDAGHSIDDLRALIASTAPVGDRAELADAAALSAAKLANERDLRNYTIVKVDDSGKTRKEPRHVSTILADVYERFLGFPRRCGGRLFDHDRDSGEVVILQDETDVDDWVRRKSKRHVDFARIDGRFISTKLLYRSLMQKSAAYDTISHVPGVPRQSKVYYAHPPLPDPSPDHKYLAEFVAHFTPATDADATLIRAFAAAPLWYRDHIHRPLWIIDSEHGQGTGKSTLVEMCASLYGPVFSVSPKELNYDPGKIYKRLVTAEGRAHRMFLLDNVTGEFKSPELAFLVTTPSINAMAPYGRNEEQRPNDLTYAITSNSANVDSDLAKRAWLIHIARGGWSPSWKSDLLAYIAEFKWHIMADIVDVLQSHIPFDDIQPGTRFPEFECEVLQAMAGDVDSYQAALETIAQRSDDVNTDEDLARTIEDTLRGAVADITNRDPASVEVFIRADALAGMFPDKKSISQIIRNLAKIGLLPVINPKVIIWPHNGPYRRRGVLWIGENFDSVSGVCNGVCSGPIVIGGGKNPRVMT